MLDQYYTILRKGIKTQRNWQMAERIYEEWLAAVKQDNKAIVHVPKKRRSAELCYTAVAQDAWMLQYVPEKLKTAKLCLAALRQDGWALEYVPEELREQIKKATGIK